MLGKMLKYDIKAMSRTFIPFYIAILVMSLFNTIFMRFEKIYAMFGGLTIFACLFIGLGVAATVMIITRFYHSVLGDEGYLTNTLPVSVDTILFSKLFAAMFWLIISGIVTILSFVVLMMGPVNMGDFFQSLGQLIQVVFDYMGTPDGFQNVMVIIAAGLLLLLLMLLALANEILHFYCSMACSQLRPFSKNRVVTSFIAYFVLGTPLSILTAALFAGVGSITVPLQSLIQSLSGSTLALLGLGVSCLIFLLLDVLLYLPTRYILKNKLNLE